MAVSSFKKKIWLSNVAQIKQINVFMHFRSCHLPFLKAIPVFKISTQILTFKKKSGKVQIQNDIFKSQRNGRNRGQKCCHCAVSIRGYSQTTYYKTRSLLRQVVLEMSSVCKFYLISVKKFLHQCQQGAGTTGCLNAKLDVLNTYLAIKSALLSHKNKICTFMRCGNLTYDPWIWLKVTSMASTASDRKSAKNP